MEYTSLGDIRKEIDSIDSQLLPLFLRRMDCSEAVAKIKIRDGLPVLNTQREEEIIRTVGEKAGDMAWAAQAMYSAIMALSRQRQLELMGKENTLPVLALAAEGDLPNEGARIFCQGVEGAYSHKAASLAFNGGDIEFSPSFEGVFEAIKQGGADFGVVPVENSAAGSVTETYSLIMKHRFYIVKAVCLSVNHCLAAKPGEEVRTVLSHPQGLMQCREYLKEKGYEKREFSNTAAAAKHVAQSGEVGLAAICSKDAAQRYGLEILEENIQDDKNNHTRFAVISKEAIFPKRAEKISLCFSLPNKAGSLSQVLERFARFGLNLTKIESRPIKGRNFEYDFYLDFAGNIREEGASSLLASLSAELPRFSFLGNYDEISS